MKKIIIIFLALMPVVLLAQTSYPRASESTINLARMFSKEIFVLNGVPYLQPLVESMNATSNSGFYNSAYVPKNSGKAYYKISANGMMGFVPDSKKTYKPQLTSDSLDLNQLAKYVEISLFPTPTIKSIKDTAGLIMYAFKVYIRRAIEIKGINPPETAPTILGHGKSVFIIPKAVLDSLVRTYPTIAGKPLFDYLGDTLKANLLNTLLQFPDYYTLPEGANLSRIIIGVPQLEIGSLYGTELLIRFIPPINWGPTIGDFAFWGIGLKHSVSQYLPERWFDAALQVVYQGTSLKNEVGVTKAQIKANASIWSFNLHLGKEIETLDEEGKILTSFGCFAGLSYDMLNINSNYSFLLPVETQLQLGLLEREQIGIDKDGNPVWRMKPPNANFPGDNQTQSLDLALSDKQFKATLGLVAQYKMVRLFAQFNFSKFDVLTAGLQVIL
jgi:hypothetical protein